MDFINTQTICVLGRQPALGLAELESLYGAKALSAISEQIAGLALSASEVNFARLGGSTRLGHVLAVVPNKLWKDVEKQLAKSLVEVAAAMPEGKLQLGISTYGIPVTPAKLTATGLTLKKIIRAKSGRSLRLSPNNELELNTAQVLHNHLTGPTGLEFLIVASDSGETLIAQTVAAQDIDSYTLRDRGRPKRDARVGMLPPKLAQILINLAASTTPGGTILDPFCGTGVVLQEALLMGFDTYGTDLEQRMIDYTRENLEWFASGQAPSGDVRMEVGDATSHTWNPPIDLVATETYLGRPFTGPPDTVTLSKTIGDCNLIISKFLKNIHGHLAPGTRLCLAVPAWQTAPSTFKHLPLIDHSSDLGYNRISFEHVRDDRLIYYREDQIVARQLLILTRQ